jgi:anti-anti-sigma factor
MDSATTHNFQINVSKNNNVGTLHLGEWFGFRSHKQFTEAYSQLLQETILQSITIDLSKINHMDSSALGMLLLLRERANEAGKSLLLVEPSEYADQVFNLTDFNSIFEIKPSK